MLRSVFIVGSITIALFAAVLSYVLGFASSRWAKRIGALDQPTGGRKIHDKPIPLFGGVGIGLTIIIGAVFLWSQGLLGGISSEQILGFVVGICILLVGGMIDDRRSLPAAVQLLFPISAAIVVVWSGTGMIQVTSPSGGAFSLVWWTLQTPHVSLPADALSVLWLVFAIYATKFLDGLDGLVTGMGTIGALMVGMLTLSTTYFQPSVAMLSGLAGGAFIGFLPHNWHPAKQFLGEAGSTIVGFTLGVLAILSSAKVAIALAVLAIPLADAVFVILGRVLRGAPPWKGDDTHLHFRLLRAGVSHQMAVMLLWISALIAGFLALGLQTRGKVFLIAGLVVFTGTTSWIANKIARTK